MSNPPRFWFFTAFLALCSVAPAQQVLTYGDDVTLPTFASQGADHATLAVNSFGDAFVAFQGEFSGGNHLVEGLVLSYLGNDQWQSQAADHLVLGDLSLHLLSNDESCSKPDVVEMPDGSFCIAWHRIDSSGTQLARLEVARLRLRDAQGVLLATPILDTQNQGEGYVADSAVQAGAAGIMVDLVNLEDGAVAAVYAHETSCVTLVNGDVFREYDLRVTRIDWNLTPGSLGFFSTPVVLASGLPFDESALFPLFGGKVLPDVVLDDFGNLVVAHEEFWMDGHGGVSGPNDGRIVVTRFAGFGAASPLLELDGDTFTINPLQRQRRPNLATSRDDNRNSVSLAWIHDVVLPFQTKSLHSREILYGVPGSSMVGTLFWGNDPLHKDALATIVHGPQRQRYTLGVRFFQNSSRILIARSNEGDMFEVPTAVNSSTRPAATLVEFPPASDTFKLFTTYEGSNSGNPATYGIHFVIFRAP